MGSISNLFTFDCKPYPKPIKFFENVVDFDSRDLDLHKFDGH